MLIVSSKNHTTGLMSNRKVSFWDIPRASQELIDSYELKKASFQQKLYKRLSRELAEEEGEGEEDGPKAAASDVVEETLTPYQHKIMEHMRNGIKMQKDISIELVKDGFTSTPQKVSQNVKWMRKKGVVILR
jgi:serine/threonine protein phosphatase PrpC